MANLIWLYLLVMMLPYSQTLFMLSDLQIFNILLLVSLLWDRLIKDIIWDLHFYVNLIVTMSGVTNSILKGNYEKRNPYIYNLLVTFEWKSHTKTIIKLFQNFSHNNFYVRWSHLRIYKIIFTNMLILRISSIFFIFFFVFQQIRNYFWLKNFRNFIV